MNNIEAEKFEVLMQTADRGFPGPLQYIYYRTERGHIQCEYNTDSDPLPGEVTADRRAAVERLLDEGMFVPTYKTRDINGRELQALEPANLLDWIELNGKLHVIRFGTAHYEDQLIEIDQKVEAVKKIKQGMAGYKGLTGPIYPYGRAIDFPGGDTGWLVLVNQRDRKHAERFQIGTTSPGRPIAFRGQPKSQQRPS